MKGYVMMNGSTTVDTGLPSISHLALAKNGAQPSGSWEIPTRKKRTWSWRLKSAYTFYPDKLQSLKLVVIIILHTCVNHNMHVFIFSLKPAGSHWLLKKAWCSHLATQTRTLPTRHASTSLTVQQARSSISISLPSTWTVMANSVAVTMWRYSSTPCQSKSQL